MNNWIVETDKDILKIKDILYYNSNKNFFLNYIILDALKQP